MYAQFFAGYLLQEKYLSKSQVIEGLKAMKKSRVKLGVLAMNAGYLTAAQVEEIHARQTKEDKRMGDIAVEMGYLKTWQVDELLANQPSRHLLLAQTLMDKEYMNNETFVQALAKFKELYNISDVDMDAVDSRKLSNIVTKLYNLESVGDSDAIAAYIILLFKNLIRFIGDDYVPVELDFKFAGDEVVKVEQTIKGEFTMSTLCETDELTFIQMASRFANEEMPILDEYSKAAVEDFMNLHNGLFLVDMSHDKNVELQLAAPEIVIGNEEKDKGLCCVPIMFSFGKVKFYLK